MTKTFFLLLGLTGLIFSGPLINPSTTGQASVPRVVVTAQRFSFKPAEVTLKRGQPVEFILRAADVAHGLRFRDLNLDIKVKKGATADVRFTPDKTGVFVGHCSVFCGSGHGAMVLTIRVVE